MQELIHNSIILVKVRFVGELRDHSESRFFTDRITALLSHRVIFIVTISIKKHVFLSEKFTRLINFVGLEQFNFHINRFLKYLFCL
jgi:hypothetical protein